VWEFHTYRKFAVELYEVYEIIFLLLKMDDDDDDIIIAATCLLLSCTTQVAVTMSQKRRHSTRVICDSATRRVFITVYFRT